MTYQKELAHHGVKGMKWGRRKVRPDSVSTPNARAMSPEEAKAQRKAKAKKAVAIGAAAVGTALAAYGGYKLSKFIKSEAGKRSYESGKKYAQEHFFSKMDMNKQAEYHSLLRAGRQTLANTDMRTRKVSNSTVEAVKYLMHPERYLVDGDLIGWWH